MLNSIYNVQDLRKLNIEQLKELSRELREYIIDVVSKNGGHLSASLGVVELTIALHYVFNTPADKIIWDVGHQCYAHKILTGRKSKFTTLRKFGGISGFPKPAESVFDSFSTGHSSTSLSLAAGEAVGRDLRHEKYKVIGVIGDGSLTGGMAFEALNHIGHLQKDVIIILNDNEHSISKNVGALSKYLMKMITGTLYNRLRRRSYDLIKKIPRYGQRAFDYIYKQEARLKQLIIPGSFFEELGIRYFGPVDGHNIDTLIEILERIKNLHNGPMIIHVLTKKGKGYEPAEKYPAAYHGVGPFDKSIGMRKKENVISYSEIAGKTLVELSKNDRKIMAITAAMKLGTGLYEFEKHAPHHFFDVGIAEQHAITFAAALASKGFKPFVSIYSTFLQRAIDQLIHDVAIMNLPVKVLIDRAGIVGEDGETHHGLFDISIIKNIPNFILLAPADGIELRDMIYFASNYDKGPVAIRYPRKTEADNNFRFDEHNEFSLDSLKKLTLGNDVAIFATGDMVNNAIAVNKLLLQKGISSSVINLSIIKPMPVKRIEKIIRDTRYYVTVENGYISGGIGEYMLSHIERDLRNRFLFAAGFPDRFIAHGTNTELFADCKMDSLSIALKIATALKNKSPHEKRRKIRRIPG